VLPEDLIPTADSYEQAIMMKREIQQTTVRDITKSVRMYYDPFPLTTESVVADDRENLTDVPAVLGRQG